jgi:hypothetical protein
MTRFLLSFLLAGSCFGSVAPMELLSGSNGREAIIYGAGATLVTLDGCGAVGDVVVPAWSSDGTLKTITYLDELDGEWLVWLGRVSGIVPTPFDPNSLFPLQWLYSVTSPDIVNDNTTNNVPAVLVDGACVKLDGTADKLTVAGMTAGVGVASSGGTSVATTGTGEITFTAGTMYDLVLSNGYHYTFCEHDGLVAYDVSTNGMNGTWTVGLTQM